MQWGLKNTGRNSGSIFKPGKAGEDINAEKAWEIEMGSEEVVIAVIDTGIKTDHPDLQENIFINEAELEGEEGVDDDGNGYIDDYHGYNFTQITQMLKMTTATARTAQELLSCS